MNELALFAGGGGSVWASAILGHRVVCAVEIEAFQRSVLLARQRDGSFPVFPVWDDVATFDGKPWRGAVDLVSGGFPCTDISLAGKGAGIDGEKSGLWREMARIIAEVQPRFVFVENVRALVSRGLDRVLGDLADLGFDAEWDCFRASDVGAPHKRERLFILAYSAVVRLERLRAIAGGIGTGKGEGRVFEPSRGCASLAFPQSDGRNQGRTEPGREQGRFDAPECCDAMADPSDGQLQEQGRRQEGRDGAGPAGAILADASSERRQQDARGSHGHESENAGRATQYNNEPERLDPGVADPNVKHDDRSRSTGQGRRLEPPDSRRDLAHPNQQHSDAGGLGTGSLCGERRQSPDLRRGFPPGPNDTDGWNAYIAQGGPEPAICRGADGLADRSKRLATLGNGWVPQVAALAWHTLLNRMNGETP